MSKERKIYGDEFNFAQKKTLTIQRKPNKSKDRIRD